MNAEQFYIEFKNCLDFLGLKWGEKDKATVSIQNGHIVITYDGRNAAFLLENPS